jgi:hypothetical protein
MGASEAQAQALLANRRFSLSVLTALIDDLERLAGFRGRDDVVALAATATKEEARFLAASVELLAAERDRGPDRPGPGGRGR